MADKDAAQNGKAPDVPYEEEPVEGDGLTEDEANPTWDDQTDAFITEIDQNVSKKYGISLRTLMTNPMAYSSNKNIGNLVGDVKDEVKSYFDGLLADLTVEQEELNKALEDADELFTKVDQAISSKAAVARVPYMKPVDVDLGDASVETILIDQYNNNLDTLITKFVNLSNYIANLSTTYDKYTLGSWLFSGERSYMVEVSRPESIVMTIDDARAYINDSVDDAAEFLSGQTAAK